MHDSPVYLTREGLEKMKAELEFLKSTKRQELAERIEKAKELGDLRENAEYHEAKDEAAAVHGRIIELTDKIQRAAVVDDMKNSDQVSLGATVVLTSENRPDKKFILVGATEADPLQGRISNESPLGRAIIGKKRGETAEINLPAGKVVYTIEEIS
jgi:transcription elongation factor GreA